MRERPILFSGPLVRAILEGRKTQTRRLAKLTDCGHLKEPGGHRRWHPEDPNAALACPYGQPGDRLWVRETFALEEWHDGISPSMVRAESTVGLVWHQANRADADTSNTFRGRWRPSIHMPRWASRIDLEVVSVRPERLWDITTDDIRAEGVDLSGIYEPQFYDRALSRWVKLWNSINGKRPGASWAANPWVWRVEFRRLEVPHA